MIPKADDVIRWCEDGEEALRYVRKRATEMARLVRLPTTKSDGFSGGGFGLGVTATAEYTSTERAADMRAFPGTGSRDSDDKVPDTIPDWVLKNLLEAFTAVREARTQAKTAERLVDIVERRGDGRVGRQETSGGICAACLRSVSNAVDDRLRGGYCDACRKAWKRWMERYTAQDNVAMATNRMAFEHARQLELTGQCATHTPPCVVVPVDEEAELTGSRKRRSA